MRSSEYAPLFRSTVGFDRLFDMLENSVRTDWPPYNIEKKSENEYRITMAVAGFGKEDVEIEVKENTLSIRGEKKEADTERTFLHRGIASRAFERRFQLADHVEVRGADVKDGLLSVDLEREVPERLKPRLIEIGATAARGNKAIDASITA
mgnify:CR=1 FL=1